MEIGQRLPEILGKDQDGKEIRLSDFAGKKLVLYAYPKDSTPGCTSEACDLRDNYEARLVTCETTMNGFSRKVMR